MMDSVKYAKMHKKDFLANVISGNSINENKKIAIFMAGTPGSGKTEVAESTEDLTPNVCHINADEFRAEFPGYDGSNSSDFQKGAAYLVDYTFSWIIAHRYSFLLDGTFSINKSVMNVQRAIDHGYTVLIYYVYQAPLTAWNFTKIREQREGRLVPADTFLNTYYAARENVIEVKAKFGQQVTLGVFLKDFNNDVAEYLDDVDNLSLILPDLYDRKVLEEIIK